MKKAISIMMSICVSCSSVLLSLTLAENKIYAAQEGDVTSLVIQDITDNETKQNLYVIGQKLSDFINEKGYDAIVEVSEEDVVVSFKQQADGEKEYDATTITQEINTFCENNGIDFSLVQVIFQANDSTEEVVITDLKVIEQKLADFIKEKGYDATADASEENVIVSFKQQADGEKEYDATTITQEINTFCENNGIDFSLVQVIFQANDSTEEVVITDLKVIEQKLADFIKEKGYDATAVASKENVIVSFKQQAVGEKEYDATAITQEIKTFCENNAIDFSLVQVIFQANDSNEEVVITDLKVIEQKLADFIKEKGYDATADASEENVIVSFKQQADGEKEYDATTITQEIKTYCDDNKLDFSLVQVIFLADNSNNTLPQTGYSNIHKVIAGLAALMTVSGVALVVKTRKENE